MTITFPSIDIPQGSEREAASLFQSVANLFQFSGDAAVNPDTNKRVVATLMEHSLSQACAQITAHLADPK